MVGLDLDGDIDFSPSARHVRSYTGRLILRLEAAWVDAIAEEFGSRSELDLFEIIAARLTGTDDEPFHGPDLTARVEGRRTARLIHRWSLAETREREDLRGATALGSYHSLNSYFSLDARGETRPQLMRLAAQLRDVEGVAAVFIEPGIGLPSPVTPDEFTYDAASFRGQGYVYGLHHKDSKWSGINAVSVWEQYDGSGVRFVDLELGWKLDHVDLPTPGGAAIPLLDPNMTNVSTKRERVHGTHTLGVVIAVDHGGQGLGVVGIAPGVEVPGLASYSYVGETDWEIADAIAAAIDVLGPGDVLLLEVQALAEARDAGVELGLPDGYPIEIHEPWLNSIRLAVLHGITVIEPAGNPTSTATSLNLDDVKWPPTGPESRSMDPHDPSFIDSGAIMVGACVDVPTVDDLHERAPGHWFGERIDCYAWAANVLTTSCSGLSLPDGTYGSVDECGDADPAAKTYFYFTGTSAASAMIAGAAALVHQMYEATMAVPALPETMRAILCDPTLGTPIGDIGTTTKSMPDLGRVAGSLTALPNVYVRDSLADLGEEPSAVVSMSPDVFVLAAALDPVNPGAPYDDPSKMVPNDLVVPYQDNYVYVRISNLSTAADAIGCDAIVYWTPSSSLVLPSDWREIDSLPATVDVPAGDQVLTAPVVWHPTAAELPTGGHGCFIVQLDHPHDPRPIPAPDTVTWDEFLSYIGRSNNVAWRNFNVAPATTVSPTPAAVIGDEWQPAHFFMRGAPDRPVPFRFAFVAENMPEDARLLWRMPAEAYGRLRIARAVGESARLLAESDQSAVLEMAMHDPALLEHVWLPANAAIPMSLGLAVRRAPEGSSPRIQLRQYFHGREVGRITWEFRARPGAELG